MQSKNERWHQSTARENK
jgi:hypothetical protein